MVYVLVETIGENFVFCIAEVCSLGSALTILLICLFKTIKMDSIMHKVSSINIVMF